MIKTKVNYKKTILILIFLIAVLMGVLFVFTSNAVAAASKCSDGIDNVPTDGTCDHADSTYRDNADGDDLYNASCAAMPADTDCVSDFDQSENSGHPFLLVKEDMYQELRDRASWGKPWSDMKTEAITDCKTVTYDLSPTAHIFYGKSGPLGKIMNSCALAYILDPDNKKIYLEKYKAGMTNWDDHRAQIINGCVPPYQNGYCVGTGGAFVMSILALDIFYNELSSGEIIAYERYFSDVWSRFLWPHNNFGTKAVWWIYKGDATLAQQYVSDYAKTIFEIDPTSGLRLVSEDGAYGAGASYGWGRIGGGWDRPGKWVPMDIATITGYFDFMHDERLEKFHQWMFHFAMNPLYGHPAFGDSGFYSYLSGNSTFPRLYTLANWSDDLAGHGAWVIDKFKLSPYTGSSIIAYVGMDKPLPPPLKPTSRIFQDGGAAFWENSPSEQSLFGAMLSTTLSEWHTHMEANSFNIVGLGEYLIPNAGGADYTVGCKTVETNTQWDSSWFKFTAKSDNTVLINDANHTLKGSYPNSGNGITEGFVSDQFDYASGDSGTALNGGHHQRNFVFVHPQAGLNQGYFVLFDEVKANNPGVKANVILHPASTNATTVISNTEYKWPMNITALKNNKTKDTNVTIFYGTEPLNVDIKNGVLGPGNGCYDAKFAQSNYATNTQGLKNIVTILFPHDATHTKANFTRIFGINYSGAEINNGNNVIDYAIESSSDNLVNYNDVSFKGLASMYRINNDENEFYFVRQGKEFNDGKDNKKGFTSNNPVSVYLKDKTGKIIVPTSGATVTFSYPGITGIKVDGVTKPVNTNILAGNHDIEILTGVVLSPADVNNDGSVNILDVQLCVNVILDTENDPAIVARAKAVVPDVPDNVCDVLDLQKIVNEILAQ